MTQPTGRKFSYPLACLLKKHQWDEQTLRQEHATADQALHRLQDEAAALRQAVGDLNSELVRMRQDAAAMDLTGQQRLIAYRDAQDQLVARKQQQVQEAAAVQEQILQQLARTRNAVKGHESHRDRLLQEHRLVAERAANVRADDEWLLRRQWLEAPRS